MATQTTTRRKVAVPRARVSNMIIGEEPKDTRGNVRIYTDVPEHVAKEFKILAIRRGVSIRALMSQLIMQAVAGK